jgi:hypothetical protein
MRAGEAGMDRPIGRHRFGGLVLFSLGLLLACGGAAAAADIKLAWSPNSEGDLAGYGIYYRIGADGPPYDLIGYVALEELPDRSNPFFTVSELEFGYNYYFAATAYDTAGNESAFSASVCGRVDERVVLCSEDGGGVESGPSGGGSAGGGSGGGGGCFIGTLP